MPRSTNRRPCLIIGRHEEEGEAPLRAAAEAITAGSIDSISTLLNLPEAQANARRCLQEIATEGLNTFWVDKSVETSQLQVPLIPTRQEVRTFQATTYRDGSRWWEIKAAYLPPRLGSRLTVEIQEEWKVRDDGASHGGRYQEKRSSRETMEYRERRLAGTMEVVCNLIATEAEPASWTVPIDDTYGCEPVLIAAGAKLARDPKARPAVFAATEKYSRLPTRWIIVPLGEWPLPAPESTKTAPAVCLTKDYDPMPIVLYYGQDSSIVAVSYDNIVWQERVAEGSAPRPGPARRMRTR